ncbi:glycosyl transferase family 1 [Nitrosopumilus sp. b3]|uniref:glycosyltransferase family 4 protein n=1 Tax=Nitrosopumilus sp. b3 TaxID=2109909 RepID=UPI0015F53ADA|nr:glycosyltransferase family 4 protein [Nitrosopumilus sp. b3]KAF6246713.1 glycosyl transferase family 1 [Nitrosopumilus sp. b3]
MRILMISPTSSGIGGISQHVQGLKKFLENKGNEVEIISSENTLTIPIKKLKNPSFMISSFFKSKFKKNFDIIHAQNPISALAMKNVKGKKILSLQGNYSEQILLLHGNTAGTLSEKLEKNALQWADVITVPSKEMYEEFTKNGYKVYYVPNAIDISSFPKDKDRRYEKQLIYAGRLSEEKGILDLLQISEKISNDIHLIIIGSGPEESKIKEKIKNKSNIHFLGYQSKENTIKLIRGSDILIQPSIMEGGTSSTLLEAMACKIPIIATSVGGNKETVIHMKTAYVVTPNHPDQIYDAINDLLDNPEKRKILTENAFEIITNYDWEHVGQKYLDVYNAV